MDGGQQIIKEATHFPRSLPIVDLLSIVVPKYSLMLVSGTHSNPTRPQHNDDHDVFMR